MNSRAREPSVTKREKVSKRRTVTFFMLANTISPHGTMGGNTKILLEFAKRWSAAGNAVYILTYEEGLKTCLDYGVTNVHYIIVPSSRFMKFGLVIFYAVQTLRTCISILKMKFSGNFIIYSASNFWPDVIPAVLIKKKNPNSKWIGTCYLLTPNPFKGFEFAYEEKWKLLPDIRLLASYFMEMVSNVLLIRYADAIFVTNDLDKKFFTGKGVSLSRLKAIYGGVDLAEITKVPEQKIKYDGCFVGRIHPQKGVTYLIDIWDKVCAVKPDAKLALIGNGPRWYENKIKNEIRKRNLEKNIDLFGFLDGLEKYKILKASKVFLHTSIYDNCGMAAAEGMACGLPVVMFDIPALRVAYPKGALVAPIRNCEEFARQVLKLLSDSSLYYHLRQDAMEEIKKWDWDRKAQEILNYVTNFILKEAEE